MAQNEAAYGMVRMMALLNLQSVTTCRDPSILWRPYWLTREGHDKDGHCNITEIVTVGTDPEVPPEAQNCPDDVPGAPAQPSRHHDPTSHVGR